MNRKEPEPQCVNSAPAPGGNLISALGSGCATLNLESSKEIKNLKNKLFFSGILKVTDEMSRICKSFVRIRGSGSTTLSVTNKSISGKIYWVRIWISVKYLDPDQDHDTRNAVFFIKIS